MFNSLHCTHLTSVIIYVVVCYPDFYPCQKWSDQLIVTLAESAVEWNSVMKIEILQLYRFFWTKLLKIITLMLSLPFQVLNPCILSILCLMFVRSWFPHIPDSVIRILSFSAAAVMELVSNFTSVSKFVHIATSQHFLCVSLILLQFWLDDVA